jgi:hypothetical protein
LPVQTSDSKSGLSLLFIQVSLSDLVS